MKLIEYYRKGLRVVHKTYPILLFSLLLATPLDDKLFGQSFTAILAIPILIFAIAFLFTPLIYYNAFLDKKAIPYNDMFKISFKNFAKSLRFMFFSIIIFIPFFVLFAIAAYIYKINSEFLNIALLPLVFFLNYMTYIYIIMKQSLAKSFSGSVAYALKNVPFSTSQMIIIFGIQILFSIVTIQKLGGQFNPYLLWAIGLLMTYVNAICEAAMVAYIQKNPIEKPNQE